MVERPVKRLEMFKGQVDDARYRAIAARFTQASKAPEEPAHEEGPTLGAGTLQDLMLQAEIPGAVRDAEQGGRTAARGFRSCFRARKNGMKICSGCICRPG